MPTKKINHPRDEKQLEAQKYGDWYAKDWRDSYGDIVCFCGPGLREWWQFPKKAKRVWLVLSTDPTEGYELAKISEYSWMMFSPSKEDSRYLNEEQELWLQEFLEKNPGATTVYVSLEY